MLLLPPSATASRLSGGALQCPPAQLHPAQLQQRCCSSLQQLQQCSRDHLQHRRTLLAVPGLGSAARRGARWQAQASPEPSSQGDTQQQAPSSQPQQQEQPSVVEFSAAQLRAPSPSSPQAGEQASTQQAAGAGATTAEQLDGKSSGDQAPSPWRELRAALAAISAFLLSVITSVQRLPAWAQAQTLRKLRDLSDEDPKDAAKHAAFLTELNKVNPKEVLARVESREYGTNAAVVIQYIRALVFSGKLSQYSGSTATQAALGMAGAGAAAGAAGASVSMQGGQGLVAEGEDHRSLYQLLKELQAQVAGDQPDDTPGSSLRRPLHVTVSGLALPGGAAMAARRSGGPLQLVWSLLGSVAVVVGLACVWLLGTQAVRRMQQAAQASATAGAVAAASSSSNVASGGAPSMDPKEYKRNELPEKAVKSFKDVRGCDEAKEELKEVVEFLKNPTRFTRLGAKLPKGVLLTGPPGTGKTLLARAVAGEAGVPFFYRAGSEFEELYVGVGSRRMRALFQAAKKKAPCIVFIDEIDAIGANRKSWDNNTRKTLNQLLVEMDGFEANEGVIVVAATNLAETLDPALKRPGRFDRQVAVPLPDLKGRQDILEYYLHDKPVSPLVDKDLLARQTQGFSGADLSNLINEAALLAAKQGADSITPSMLDSSFDKIRMGVERKSVRRTPDSIKRTAYHEAGHTLVATSTPGASPVHKATIIPRGHALGMVTQVGREDEFSINKQQMLARIWVCMGGQVAEELIFGKDQVTSGATDDLRQATEMARYMVAECGLDDEIGPVHVSDRSAREGTLSEQLKQRIDHQVRGLLVEAREGVKALLASRMADLHTLAQALIDQETLTAEQIHSLLATGKLPEAPTSGGAEAGPGANGGGGGGGGEDKDPKGQLEGVLAAQPPQHQQQEQQHHEAQRQAPQHDEQEQ